MSTRAASWMANTNTAKCWSLAIRPSWLLSDSTRYVVAMSDDSKTRWLATEVLRDDASSLALDISVRNVYHRGCDKKYTVGDGG